MEGPFRDPAQLAEIAERLVMEFGLTETQFNAVVALVDCVYRAPLETADVFDEWLEKVHP